MMPSTRLGSDKEKLCMWLVWRDLIFKPLTFPTGSRRSCQFGHCIQSLTIKGHSVRPTLENGAIINAGIEGLKQSPSNYTVQNKMVNFQYNIKQMKGKYVSFNDAPRAHWFSYHRLLDVKHMALVTYFFRQNPLSPHTLPFPISTNGSFICTFPQTGQ